MATNQANGVPPRKNDERQFDRIMRERYLVPFLDGVLAEVRRTNAATPAGELAAVLAFVQYWRRERDPAFPEAAVQQWAEGVDIRHARRFRTDIKRLGAGAVRSNFQPASADDIVERTVHESISLIKSIPQRYHAALAAKVIRAQRENLLDESIQRSIYASTGKLSGYWLRRITRDQSNKLSGALNIHRLKEAGITHYRWVTSQDERVRPAHADRNGQIFSIYDGSGLVGDMHPGDAIQCRCVAAAYIPRSF